jgi:hypothetical protein
MKGESRMAVQPPDDGAFSVFEWLARYGYALMAGVGVIFLSLLGAAWRAGRTFSDIKADMGGLDKKIDATSLRIDAAETRIQGFEAEWRQEVRRLGDKIDGNHRQVVDLLMMGRKGEVDR